MTLFRAGRLTAMMLLGMAAPAWAQEPAVVVVSTAAGDVTLGPWAMPDRGKLRLGEGTLAAAPAIAGFTALSVVHANWEFAVLILGKEDLLQNERAERRTVPTFSRRLDARRVSVMASDLAEPARLARRLRDLRASADDPVYAFVGVQLRRPSRTGIETGASSADTALSDAAFTTRFEGRFYVFKVAPPPE